MLASPIQGHTSILESDFNQNGTHLLLTDNNICHNIRSLAHTLSPGLQKVHMEALCPIMSGNAVIMSACLGNMNVRSMTPLMMACLLCTITGKGIILLCVKI